MSCTRYQEIYDNIANDLQLTILYDPGLLLGGQNQASYNLERAVVESTYGGSQDQAKVD